MNRIIDLCRRVPLLPVVIILAFPLAVWGQYRPWGQLDWPFDPGLGELLVVVFVIYTVIDTLRGMIDDIRNGHVGVDILAVVAILSTVAVQEFWASWAVMLMIYSGEAIEEYAQAKAEHSLTALMSAAPQVAHVATLPGVGPKLESMGAPEGAGKTEDGFRPADAGAVSDGGIQTETAQGAGDAGGRVDRGEGIEGAEQAAVAALAQNVSKLASNPTAGHFRTIPVDEVKLGDVLVVLPGETVPVDGELLSGSATLDLSNINGEPVPREIFAGGRVMSGAINGSAALTMRSTQLARDSQYQRILALVASAQNSRAAVVRTADLLAVPFTVIAFIIACVAWTLSGVPLRFAQVLVLATPCPLLIAAPVAYIAGTSRLAKAGILIKSQEVLENLGRVSHIFFDKTGTLTVKKPRVVRVDVPGGGDAGHAAANSSQSDEILRLAGIVEAYSVHILAQGIAAAGAEAAERLGYGHAAGALGKQYPVVAHIHEDAGRGVSGEVDGRQVRVGRYAFVMNEEGVKVPQGLFPERAADEMATYVAIDGTLAARIVLKDVPRANAASSLAKLRELGITRLTMLTGDKEASARIIADEVGIDNVYAELFPEGKVAAIKNASLIKPGKQPWWDVAMQKLTGENRRHSVTMMVGDGVNDAPVLAAADIGMAITDGTSTAASESAQVVIMNDDISAVPTAVSISRRTKRVMLQAVVVGLALAIIGMLAAAFNLIPVVVGAFIQELIDVVSILWALTAVFDRD